MPFFTSIYSDLLELILPRYCSACSIVLQTTEKHICVFCLYDLPLTRFEFYKDNPLHRLFWGRVMLQQATALLYFKRCGKARKIIHQLKYKGQSALAYQMGFMLGLTIKNSPVFEVPDLIIPVPSGASKTRSRGYNQCTHIANGLADATNSHVREDLLKTGKSKSTQTRKGRYARYLNVKDGFILGPGGNQKSSVLLVDDVVTTGATLESCARTLQEGGFSRISIAALAWTS